MPCPPPADHGQTLITVGRILGPRSVAAFVRGLRAQRLESHFRQTSSRSRGRLAASHGILHLCSRQCPTGSTTETGRPQEVPSRSQDAGTLNPPRHNLQVVDWLFRSSAASLIWLVVRLWLGYQYRIGSRNSISPRETQDRFGVNISALWDRASPPGLRTMTPLGSPPTPGWGSIRPLVFLGRPTDISLDGRRTGDR
jgi:hypothetical protein